VGQHEFRLPDLGEGLESAEIVTWLVGVGDRVEVDEPLLEVETAKANVELPSPFAGVVVTLHGDPGATVAVGAPLVTIAADAEAFAAEPERALVGYGDAVATAAPPRRRGTLATPPVRKLAGELGVDLAGMSGSGPRGRVTRGDVMGARAPSAEPEGRTVPMRGVRKTIADRMVRSHRDIPDASTWTDADATELMALRDALRSDYPDAKITPLVLLLRICVSALRQFPILNSRLDESATEIELLEPIHLGVATQTQRGLLVPVIREAHRLTTLELATELTRLVGTARDATSTPAELSGSTFTVSNYGAFGLDGGVAIINHPEVAILGVGRIAARPWVVHDALAVRQVVQLSLSFDHRVCDGADAGAFLRFVADRVERPASLLATV
jgi:2-oxoisovalerate dehydrogenase E2 component (dihydrolipoyl transacylase)